MKRRPSTAAWIAATVCAVVSALVGWWVAQPLFLLGGTVPATIWGPAWGGVGTTAALAVAVLAVLLAPAGRRRLAVAGWFAALLVLTHRVADQGHDGVRDLWLGVTVATIPFASEEPAIARCGDGVVPALCVRHGARGLRTPTLVPFSPEGG